jgi:hypothetical protein
MKNFITLILLASILFACKNETKSVDQTAQKTEQSATVELAEGLQLIQFHSEHRCKTCLLIEENAKKTAENSGLKFVLINVDDEMNDALSEKFEASGTALILYDKKSDKFQDLTDFAFMNANDNIKFVEELTQTIKTFN